MPSLYAIEKAAQAWCKPGAANEVMNEKLCMAFAEVIDEIKPVKKFIMVDTTAGTIILNVDIIESASYEKGGGVTLYLKDGSYRLPAETLESFMSKYL